MAETRVCWSVWVNIRGSAVDMVCVCRCDGPDSLAAVVSALAKSGDTEIQIIKVQREIALS
jgi:hypothetical protein